MTLRTLTRFRNPDNTADLNNRIRDLILPGIFFGGTVTPVVGTLQVDVQPFGAMGADGMVTLLEGTPERVSVQAGTTNLILLHAKYVANDAPTAEIETLTQSQFDALSSTQQSERIQLAKITLAVGATEVVSTDIDTREADLVDQQGRSSFRGTADTLADLPDYTEPPTGVTTQNRPDDIWFVSDDRVFYSWNTSGTPQWSAVISSAAETELLNHKNNQDDGATAPDFINAQHVLVKHRASLDEGTAGTKLFGSGGTDFGAGNAFVDEKFPHTILKKADFTDPFVTQVQLTGKVYVGTGAIGTAEQYLRLAFVGLDKQLLGTDNRDIVVNEVLDPATGTVQIEPSTDADALGFIEDPWVSFDFSATSDVNTSSVSVWYHTAIGIGEATVAEKAAGHAFGFDKAALHVPMNVVGFDHISATNAQGGFSAVDSIIDKLALLGKNVLTVGPTGSGALFEGNDQAPFNSAVAEAASQVSGGGGTVTIAVLPGTYTFTSRVAVTSAGTVITGVTDPRISANAAHFTGDDGFFFVIASDVSIQNLSFDDRRTAGSDPSIDMTATNFRCSGCYFQRDTAVAVGSSIFTNNGDLKLTIDNNKFKLGANVASSPAIQLTGTNSVDFYNNFITDEGATITEQSHFIDIDSSGFTHACNIQIRDNIYQAETASVVESFVHIDRMGGLDVTASEFAISSVTLSGNTIDARGADTSWVRNLATDGDGKYDLILRGNHVVWGAAFLDGGVDAATSVRNTVVDGNKIGVGETLGISINRAFVSTKITNNTISSVENGVTTTFATSGSPSPVSLIGNTWTITGASNSGFTFPSSSILSDNRISYNNTGTELPNMILEGEVLVSGNIFDFNPSGTIASATNDAFIYTTADENVIQGNRFNGDTDFQTISDLAAIRLNGSDRNIVKDNIAVTGWSVFVLMDGTSAQNEIASNYAEDCTAFVDGGSTAHYNVVHNNRYRTTTTSTAHFGGSYNAIFTLRGLDSLCKDNVIGGGVAPTHSRAVTVLDPVIYIGGSDSVVEGNYITACGNANVGIYAPNNRNNIRIRNNHIETLGKSAEWTSDPDDIIGILFGESGNDIFGGCVDGNVIRDIHRTGVSSAGTVTGIYSAGVECSISGNDIDGDGTDYTAFDRGIYAPTLGNYCTLSKNNLSSMVNPIEIDGEHHVISGNTIRHFKRGMYISDGEAHVTDNYLDFRGVIEDVNTSDIFIGINVGAGNNNISNNTLIDSVTSAQPTVTGHRCVIGVTGSSNVIKGNLILDVRYATCGIRAAGPAVIEGNHIRGIGIRRGSPVVATPTRCYGIWLYDASDPGDVAAVIANNNVSGIGVTGCTGIGIINNAYDGVVVSGNNLGDAVGAGVWDKALVNETNADNCTFVGNNFNGRGVTDSGTNSHGDPTSGTATTGNMNNL